MSDKERQPGRWVLCI